MAAACFLAGHGDLLSDIAIIVLKLYHSSSLHIFFMVLLRGRTITTKLSTCSKPLLTLSGGWRFWLGTSWELGVFMPQGTHLGLIPCLFCYNSWKILYNSPNWRSAWSATLFPHSWLSSTSYSWFIIPWLASSWLFANPTPSLTPKSASSSTFHNLHPALLWGSCFSGVPS